MWPASENCRGNRDPSTIGYRLSAIGYEQCHYRAALGKATQEAALKLQRELIAAARRRDKRAALQAADEALHELRVLLRQGQALSLMTLGQYEHVTRMVDEVGRLLGGWRPAIGGVSDGQYASSDE